MHLATGTIHVTTDKSTSYRQESHISLNSSSFHESRGDVLIGSVYYCHAVPAFLVIPINFVIETPFGTVSVPHLVCWWGMTFQVGIYCGKNMFQHLTCQRSPFREFVFQAGVTLDVIETYSSPRECQQSFIEKLFPGCWICCRTVGGGRIRQQWCLGWGGAEQGYPKKLVGKKFTANVFEQTVCSIWLLASCLSIVVHQFQNPVLVFINVGHCYKPQAASSAAQASDPKPQKSPKPALLEI